MNKNEERERRININGIIGNKKEIVLENKEESKNIVEKVGKI